MPLTGHRILVVEDDCPVALGTARALRVAGAEVIGPCSTEEAARKEIYRNRLTGAIVDINLGPNLSFKLAETLLEREIPFVFFTGSDPDIIPDRFSNIECLWKPAALQDIIRAISKL